MAVTPKADRSPSAKFCIAALLGITALGAALTWVLWRPRDGAESARSPSPSEVSEPRVATSNEVGIRPLQSQPGARVTLEKVPREGEIGADDGVAPSLRVHLGEIVSLGPLSESEVERALAIVEELGRGRESSVARANEKATSGDPKAIHDAAVALHEAEGFRLVPEALQTGFYFVQDPKARQEFVPVLDGCYVTTLGLQSDSGTAVDLTIALPYDVFLGLRASNDYMLETRRLYLESLCDEFNRKEFDERKRSIDAWFSHDSEDRKTSRMRKYMTQGIHVDRQRYVLRATD